MSRRNRPLPTVYNQTVSCRFGVELADQFGNETWTRFDVAVAWVRRSGIRHLTPALTEFLRRRGTARFVVGIDIENTSKEGLEALLTLEEHGKIETYVHHNEHPSVTFHPKVYLFSGKHNARLIIGSNNLTESGLFTNTEAGLQVDAAVTDTIVTQMLGAIESWCQPAGQMAHPLDAAFLEKLVENGYVSSEETLNRRRASTRRAAVAPGDRPRERLFGSREETAPHVEAAGPSGAAATPRRARSPGSTAPTTGAGAVLLMWPAFSRGDTQMQFPKRLRNGPFFIGVTTIESDHDHRARGIPETHPDRDKEKGKSDPNTYKFHVPEAKPFNRPVVRFWRTSAGVVMYRVYDQASPEGQFIMQKLDEGRHTTPPLTTVTKPSEPESATWFRFV